MEFRFCTLLHKTLYKQQSANKSAKYPSYKEHTRNQERVLTTLSRLSLNASNVIKGILHLKKNHHMTSHGRKGGPGKKLV
jgi:hypothetical protein